MPVVVRVLQNSNGGSYHPGVPFTDAKWVSVTRIYEKELEAHGKCTVQRLAERAQICKYSARKLKDYYDSGIHVPPLKAKDHRARGVGSLLGWEMCHHVFLYDLYRDNP